MDARSKTITIFKSLEAAAAVTDWTSYSSFPTVARKSDAGGTLPATAGLLGNTRKLVSSTGFGAGWANVMTVPHPAKNVAAHTRPATHPGRSVRIVTPRTVPYSLGAFRANNPATSNRDRAFALTVILRLNHF